MNYLVSIIIVAYEHSKYLKKSIESVLNQTHEEIEVLIINNSSSDNSLFVIREFTDQRIKVTSQKNFGPSAAFNYGIELSKGEFLVILSGDDFLAQDFIEINLTNYFKNQTLLTFSLPKLIDESDQLLNNSHFQTFYTNNFVNEYDLFRSLFYKTNFLCAPTAFFHRKVFEKVGKFKISLFQLQDFDFWLRCCEKVSVSFIPKSTVFYRIRKGNLNLSSKINNPRTELEMIRIYQNLLSSISPEFLQRVFPEFLSEKEVDLFIAEANLARIYLSHSNINIQRIGIQNIASLIDDPVNYKKLLETFNFDLINFIQIESYFGKDLICE